MTDLQELDKCPALREEVLLLDRVREAGSSHKKRK
jgi:hypothetical protein